MVARIVLMYRTSTIKLNSYKGCCENAHIKNNNYVENEEKHSRDIRHQCKIEDKRKK